MKNEIVQIIDAIDHCVKENDATIAPDALRRKLALLELAHGRELVMDAICRGYVIADRRRQYAGGN